MNLTRVRGDTYSIKATLKLNNAAVNLTTSTAKFSYRNEESTVVRSIDGAGNVNGEVVFLPSASDFQDVGLYTYDIEVTSPTQEKTTYIIAKLNIIDDITK
jgi:hypothetical protein